MSTPKTVYLDYAAATPIDPQVLAAMLPYFSDKFYNPSAIYLSGLAVAKQLNAARSIIAECLGSRPSEIVFTAGGTEANNLAVQGVMQTHPDGNLVISTIEHDSVIKPAQLYRHKRIKVSPDGLIDLKDLQKKIDAKTVLISVMYANNEIGTIEPIREISKLIDTIRRQRIQTGNDRPLYFHTDACQAANYLDLHVNRLGVDLMTVNGGKIYGPKQSAALFIKTGVQLRPQILGGGQENAIRSGTENVASAIGLSKALSLVQSSRKLESNRLKKLQQLFTDLLKEAIPEAKINGSTKHRLVNNLHLTIPGADNERLMMNLDEHGVICGVGSACSASSDESSHVLKAIGLSEKAAQASLRFSLGKGTKDSDIRLAVRHLKDAI